jgi:adenylate kinase family enzyme
LIASASGPYDGGTEPHGESRYGRTDGEDDEQQCHSLSGKLIDDTVVCETILKEFNHMHEQQQQQQTMQPQSSTLSNTMNHPSRTNIDKGYILDGFPRTLQQITIMETICPSHYRIDGAIKLAVPDYVCKQKLLGRRLCLKCHGNYNVGDVHYHDRDSNRWWNIPAYLPASASSSAPTITTTKGGLLESTTSSSSKSTSKSSFVVPSSLSCGCDPTVDWVSRHDDQEDIVEHRLQIYHQHMDPILDYFDDNFDDLDDNDKVKADQGTTTTRRQQKRLLKLYPYNGFDDVPQIIQTVKDWVQE